MFRILACLALVSLLPLSSDAQATGVAPAPVEIEVFGAELTLFPTPTEPALLTVRARALDGATGSLRCRVIIDNLERRTNPGYVGGEEVTLSLDESGAWHEGVLTVAATGPAPPPMVTGKLLITGRAGTHTVRRDIPLRVGRGALGFLERRAVQFPEGPLALDAQCLENRFIRAEFIPPVGVLSGLFSQRVRRNALVPGDYPLGFMWAGTGEWYHRTSPPPGPAVTAEFRTRHGGAPILMQATLGQDDQALTIDLDPADLEVPPGPLLLMTTLSHAGGDSVRVPLAGGITEVIPGAEPRRITAGALAARRLEIYLAALDETLVITFTAPALTAVEVGAQAPWYNYVALHLSESPGKMQFRLALQ